MEVPIDLSKLTYYEFNLSQARALFNEAVIDEDEHQVIVNNAKLQESQTICTTLTAQRGPVPLDIQAEANYYLSFGRSDTLALQYLTKAVSCCESYEAQTGFTVPGSDFIEEALQEMHISLGAEQSEYGGVAVASGKPAAATEVGKHEGGLLEARRLPMMTITAPSPSSGLRRKLPSVRRNHTRRESLGDEEKQF